MAIPVNKNRSEAIEKLNPEQKVSLQWVEKITSLLDTKFNIPGTKIRFGLDPILGFVPVLGDVASYIISMLLIYTMSKYGASKTVVAKMLFNASLDALIGSIPGLGTLFDIWFKANQRNLKLLQTYYFQRDQVEQKEPFNYAALAFIIMLLLLCLCMATYFYFDLEVFYS
ncbi:MAG: DUF4112 domain-containing protein [Bacteroidota bacterium]